MYTSACVASKPSNRSWENSGLMVPTKRLKVESYSRLVKFASHPEPKYSKCVDLLHMLLIPSNPKFCIEFRLPSVISSLFRKVYDTTVTGRTTFEDIRN